MQLHLKEIYLLWSNVVGFGLILSFYLFLYLGIPQLAFSELFSKYSLKISE